MIRFLHRVKSYFREIFKTLFRFSGQEGKRILLLIPLLALLTLLFVWQGKPHFDERLTQYEPRKSDSLQGKFSNIVRKRPQKDSLFYFDPNTISLEQLKALGFSAKQGQVILRYRERGAVFHTPADFARSYVVSDQRFRRLKPYIRITPLSGKKDSIRHFITRPKRDTHFSGATPSFNRPYRGTRQADSLFLFDPNTVSATELMALGFSRKQAEVIVHYRESGAVFRTSADFARCYVVSEKRFRTLEPYIRIEPPSSSSFGVRFVSDSVQPSSDARTKPLELNSADSSSLVKLRGIGSLTAGRIVKYRYRLGGFACAEQLREIQGMTPENFQRILSQISVDSSKIKKIDINFATPDQMESHPYLSEQMLNRLLKYRQLKGGWRSTRELIDQHIMSQEQAGRLSPYLEFR